MLRTYRHFLALELDAPPAATTTAASAPEVAYGQLAVLSGQMGGVDVPRWMTAGTPPTAFVLSTVPQWGPLLDAPPVATIVRRASGAWRDDTLRALWLTGAWAEAALTGWVAAAANEESACSAAVGAAAGSLARLQRAEAARVAAADAQLRAEVSHAANAWRDVHQSLLREQRAWEDPSSTGGATLWKQLEVEDAGPGRRRLLLVPNPNGSDHAQASAIQQRSGGSMSRREAALRAEAVGGTEHGGDSGHAGAGDGDGDGAAADGVAALSTQLRRASALARQASTSAGLGGGVGGAEAEGEGEGEENDDDDELDRGRGRSASEVALGTEAGRPHDEAARLAADTPAGTDDANVDGGAWGASDGREATAAGGGETAAAAAADEGWDSSLLFQAPCELVWRGGVVVGSVSVSRTALAFEVTPPSAAADDGAAKPAGAAEASGGGSGQPSASAMADGCPVGEGSRTWRVNQLRQLQRRRYLLSHTALEVFTTQPAAPSMPPIAALPAPPLFLQLHTKRKREALRRALRRVGVPERTWRAARQSLLEAWHRREISNFDYLMELNTLSGRTYNDLNQCARAATAHAAAPDVPGRRAPRPPPAATGLSVPLPPHPLYRALPRRLPMDPTADPLLPVPPIHLAGTLSSPGFSPTTPRRRSTSLTRPPIGTWPSQSEHSTRSVSSRSAAVTPARCAGMHEGWRRRTRAHQRTRRRWPSRGASGSPFAAH